MSKAKFEQAREWIREKRYDEARQLLEELRPHPRAEQWLEKLDAIAPTQPPLKRQISNPKADKKSERKGFFAKKQPEPPPDDDPETLTQQEMIDRQVKAALDARDEQERKKRRRWWLIRTAIFATLFLCSFSLAFPSILFVANLFSLPQADWVNEQVARFEETVIGQAVTGVNERIVSTTTSQLAPVVEGMCSDQFTGASQTACEDYLSEMLVCLSEKGDMTACLEDMQRSICRQQFPENTEAYSMCIESLQTTP